MRDTRIQGPRSARRVVGAVAAALALVATACGSDDAASEPVSTESVDESPDDPTTESAVDSTAPEPQQTGPVALANGTPLLQLPEGGPDPVVGTATPVVEGELFDGTPITIGGPTERPTMYVFLAHWCPHCNDEVPQLIDLEETGTMPADLDVVGISTAVASDRPNYPPSEWASDKGWLWPMMADDEASSAFQIFGGSSFPYTVVAAADGTVLARWSGELGADGIAAQLAAALPA